MFVLMLVAIYGIIGELSHPGAILPGVAGALALVLALYMGSVLPINAAGLALILLAVALFIIDVFAATHGVLTAGGIAAFLLGSLLLFNREPGFHLPLTWIIPATVLTALFFLIVIGAGLRAQFLPAKTGREGTAGQNRHGPDGGGSKAAARFFLTGNTGTPSARRLSRRARWPRSSAWKGWSCESNRKPKMLWIILIKTVRRSHRLGRAAGHLPVHSPAQRDAHPARIRARASSSAWASSSAPRGRAWSSSSRWWTGWCGWTCASSPSTWPNRKS